MVLRKDKVEIGKFLILGGQMSAGDSRSTGWVRTLIFIAIIAAFSVMPAAAQKQAESKNMELVGWNDLQGRSAYQPTIHKQGARWIAYVGHHGGENLNALTGKKEINGTSVVD